MAEEKKRDRHPIVTANSELYGVFWKKRNRVKLTDKDFQELADAKAAHDKVWNAWVEKLKSGTTQKKLDADYKEWKKLYGKSSADVMYAEAKRSLAS